MNISVNKFNSNKDKNAAIIREIWFKKLSTLNKKNVKEVLKGKKTHTAP